MLGSYWGSIGGMEKKMETTIVYWGYFGIVDKKMETAIVDRGYAGAILGYWKRKWKLM